MDKKHADRYAQEERRVNGEPKRVNWWLVFVQILLAGACLVLVTMLLGRGG